MSRYLVAYTLKTGEVEFQTDDPADAKAIFLNAFERFRTPCSVTDRELNTVVLDSTMPPKHLSAMLERLI